MTKQKTGPLLTLDMVAGTKEAKFRLKYVIFSQAKKRKELFAPSDCSEWLYSTSSRKLVER